jgi:hypothetical protein
VTTRRQVDFTEELAEPLAALDAVAAGRGWCNLTPEIVADDVEVLSVNVFQLRAKRGAPVATFVTAPSRKGDPQPSTLGVLHTRGKLGMERIDRILDGAPFGVRQDHMQRGLLLEVPVETSSSLVLTSMRALLTALCDYEPTGRWRMDVFERA